MADECGRLSKLGGPAWEGGCGLKIRGEGTRSEPVGGADKGCSCIPETEAGKHVCGETSFQTSIARLEQFSDQCLVPRPML